MGSNVKITVLVVVLGRWQEMSLDDGEVLKHARLEDRVWESFSKPERDAMAIDCAMNQRVSGSIVERAMLGSELIVPPYNPRDMMAAAAYRQQTEDAFEAGRCDEAYELYLRDPCGGASSIHLPNLPSSNQLSKVDFAAAMTSILAESDFPIAMLKQPSRFSMGM